MLRQFFNKYRNSEVVNSARDAVSPVNTMHHDNYLRVDIEESTEGYVITADLPGYNKDNVTINVDDKTITIIATPQEKENKHCFLRSERYHGRRERSFTINHVNFDLMTYTVEDGLLTVRLPKIV